MFYWWNWCDHWQSYIVHAHFSYDYHDREKEFLTSRKDNGVSSKNIRNKAASSKAVENTKFSTSSLLILAVKMIYCLY